MKLLTIIMDAAGALHIEATRAPDLRRREISSQSGSAEILFCATPPEGKSAHEIAALLQGILVQNNAMGRKADRAKVQRAALWHIHLKPVLSRIGHRIRRPLMKLLRLPILPWVIYRLN